MAFAFDLLKRFIFLGWSTRRPGAVQRLPHYMEPSASTQADLA
jgi:hypothetical protein